LPPPTLELGIVNVNPASTIIAENDQDGIQLAGPDATILSKYIISKAKQRDEFTDFNWI
jgi:hypothetical protein